MFHFDSGSSLAILSTTNGAVVNLNLDDPAGWGSMLWQVESADGVSEPADWVIANATSITGATVTVPVSPTGIAALIRATGMRGGQMVTARAKLYVAPLVGCADERNETDSTYGMGLALNDTIRILNGSGIPTFESVVVQGSDASLTIEQNVTNQIDIYGGAGDSIKILSGSGGHIDLEVGSGQTVKLRENDSDVCTFTLDADGACSQTWGAGCTSVTYGQAQKASGAGGSTTLRAQQGQAGSIGGKVTIGGGLGGTPGTNLAGGVDVELGQAVANVSAKCRFLAGAAGATAALTIKQGASNYTVLDFGDNDAALTGGLCRATFFNVECSTSISLTAPDVYTIANTAIHNRVTAGTGGRILADTTGREYKREIPSTVGTSDATPTPALTFATTAGRAYGVHVAVSASNDTDDTTYFREFVAQFKRPTTTLSQPGASTAVFAALGDYTPGGVAIDFNSNDIRVMVTGTLAKAVNWNVTTTLYTRVIA